MYQAFEYIETYLFCDELESDSINGSLAGTYQRLCCNACPKNSNCIDKKCVF